MCWLAYLSRFGPPPSVGAGGMAAFVTVHFSCASMVCRPPHIRVCQRKTLLPSLFLTGEPLRLCAAGCSQLADFLEKATDAFLDPVVLLVQLYLNWGYARGGHFLFG